LRPVAPLALGSELSQHSRVISSARGQPMRPAAVQRTPRPKRFPRVGGRAIGTRPGLRCRAGPCYCHPLRRFLRWSSAAPARAPARSAFVRIRHYGWMANRCRRERAALCRTLLGQEAEQLQLAPANTGTPSRQCPFCGGVVEVVERIVPRELSRHRQSRKREFDSS
jgi:hypothetical protein